MVTRPAQPRMTQSMRRRRLLQSGLAAGATLATWPLYRPGPTWGAEAGSPRRGGILRARGWDPVHFDPQVTRNFKSHTTLSFVYSKLLRHKVGPDVPPGAFSVEPDLAERWESPDDTTYIFYLRQGKFDGMALGPFAVGWEADSSVYGPYAPDQPRNRGHVNDPKITAMVQEQRRTKDPAARKQILSDFQRYAAEQQYYVYLFSQMITSSWQPYLKNYSHNLTFDYGSRIAVSWLDR